MTMLEEIPHASAPSSAPEEIPHAAPPTATPSLSHLRDLYTRASNVSQYDERGQGVSLGDMQRAGYAIPAAETFSGVPEEQLDSSQRTQAINGLSRILSAYDIARTHHAMTTGTSYPAADEMRQQQAQVAQAGTGSLSTAAGAVGRGVVRTTLALTEGGAEAANVAAQQAAAKAHPIAAAVGYGTGKMLAPESMAAIAATGGLGTALAPELGAGGALAAGAAGGATYGATAQTIQQKAEGEDATPIRNALFGGAAGAAGEVGGALMSGATQGLKPAARAAARLAGGAGTGGAINVGLGDAQAALQGQQRTNQERISDFLTGAAQTLPLGVPGALQETMGARDHLKATDPNNSAVGKLDTAIAQHVEETRRGAAPGAESTTSPPATPPPAATPKLEEIPHNMPTPPAPAASPPPSVPTGDHADRVPETAAEVQGGQGRQGAVGAEPGGSVGASQAPTAPGGEDATKSPPPQVQPNENQKQMADMDFKEHDRQAQIEARSRLPLTPERTAEMVKSSDEAIAKTDALTKGGAEPLVGQQAKEPWQMTRAEFQKENTIKGWEGEKTQNALGEIHKNTVILARMRNEAVPTKVMKDYPELKGAPDVLGKQSAETKISGNAKSAEIHSGDERGNPAGNEAAPAREVQDQGKDQPENAPVVNAEPKSVGPGAAEKSDPNFRIETGGAAVTPDNAPRVIATTLSPPASAARQALSTMEFLRGKLAQKSQTARDVANAIGDSVRRYAQQTFPALHRGSTEAGNAAATLISSREIIRRQSDAMTAHVMDAMGGTKEMDTKLGAVLVEDQLKGIRQKFTDRMNQAVADSAKAKTPEESAALDAEADKNRKLAANVKSIIGAPDSPFKTESDYKAALADDDIQAGLAAHRQFVEPVTEENYRLAKQLDPEQELPARGADTNSHISLKAIREGEGEALTSRGLKAGGNVENTLRKYSPFDREAKGNADQYELRYSELVDNSIERGTVPAAQARFYKAMQDGGLAVVQKTGLAPTIDGKPTTGFKIETKPGQSLYVRSAVAPEARLALNIDKAENPMAIASSVTNQFALLSLVEAISHASNHLAVLYKSPLTGYHLPTWLANVPGAKVAGILDAVGTNTYRMLTKRLGTLEHLSELANIGALKPDYSETEGVGGGPMSKLNPARYVGKVVDTMATASRLALDDGYKAMADKGIVQDTPQARRDYINQLGQYHKQAQAGLVRVFRNIGLGPFATAGSTFYTQGLRALTGSTGAKATSPANAARLRSYVVAQLGGTLALVALTNYLRTGSIQPAGTPWGSLVLKKNADGSHDYEDVADLIGVKRGMRAVGADAAIESAREHRPAGSAIDKSAKQAISAAASPLMGPLPTAAITAATGVNVHGLYDAAGRAAPGESQVGKNLAAAARGMNPTVGLLAEGSQEGKTGAQQVVSQLGRFAPKTGTVSKYATKDSLVDALRKDPKDVDAAAAMKKLPDADQRDVSKQATFKNDDAYFLLTKSKLEDMVTKLEGMSPAELRASAMAKKSNALTAYENSTYAQADARLHQSNADPSKVAELKSRLAAIKP